METLLFAIYCVAVLVGLIFIFRVSELSRALRKLETEMGDLRRRIGELSSSSPARESTPNTGPAAQRLTDEMLAIERQVEGVRGTPAPSLPVAILPEPKRLFTPPAPPPTTAQPPKPSRTRGEWEQLIGGKLLNRIGALALIIGVGFFLKYAFDNNWLSQTVRVLIGAAAGISLLGGAAYFRKKGLAIFAQGLVGAGIAILYLSVYASFNFYHLVAQPTAFVLMAAVTVIAFTQAFFYDSLAVSLLGWAGGFLTPFLLSTGEANETGLFTYVALLDAGLLAVILRKQAWQVLHPLTAGASYLIFILWFMDSYRPEMSGLTVFFIALLWALFLVLDLLGRPRPTPPARVLHELVGIANALFLYFAVLAALHAQHEALNGTAIACMALLYGIATLAATRSAPGNRMRFIRLLLTAIALATLAIEAEYEGYTVILLWALEAAVILWSSVRWKVKALAVAAVVLYGITAVAILVNPKTYLIDPNEFRLLINPRCAGLALYALALALAPAALKNISTGWRRASDVFRWAWAAVLFLLLTGEVNDLFREWHAGAAGPEANAVLSFHHFLALAGTWTVAGLVLGAFGSRRAFGAVRNAGGAMLVVSMALLGAVALNWTLPPGIPAFLNFRMSVVLVTAAVALFFARSVPFTPLVRTFWQYAAYALLFFLLRAEFGDWLGVKAAHAVGEEAEHYWYLSWLVLAGVWALYGLALILVGRRTGWSEPVWAGLLSLAAAFITAAVQGISYAPVTWVTLVVNARFGSLAVVIASLIAGRRAASTLERVPFPWIYHASLYAGLFLLLLLLTAETRDLFERLIANTSREGGDAVARELSRLENLKQLSLSGVWLLFAAGLMTAGLLSRSRPLRLAAIGLLGFTILKIFLYDLSFLETLYRIFSFIGLGIILLAASYAYQRNKELILGHVGEKTPAA